MKTYYDKVTYISSLQKAWKKVLENGKQSVSPETRNEIEQFSLRIDTELRRIYSALHSNKFAFDPAKGVAQKKPGKKKPRPIVIASVKNRIVQRSILDALHSCDKICEYEKIETSFGGIEKRGVPQAIAKVHNAIKDGYEWYIRSDISDFFTHISRERVLKKIADCIPEDRFLKLLSEAINVELYNMAQLGKTAEIFPIYTIGVAQGCCLSPLMGNLLLNDFDQQMNGRNIITLRYIDDFIVLGKELSSVKKTFETALKMLVELGLTAYSPWDGTNKAEMGNIKTGINFLGCDIYTDKIRPDTKARSRLFQKLDKIISVATTNIRLNNKKSSYLSTMKDIHNLLRGWGNTYFFCNDKPLMRDLDFEVDKRIKDFGHFYLEQARTMTDFRDKRRLQGIHLLSDSNFKPIIPTIVKK